MVRTKLVIDEQRASASVSQPRRRSSRWGNRSTPEEALNGEGNVLIGGIGPV
jgi:hypothetical protein